MQKLANGTWSRTGTPAVLVNPESATSHYCRNNRSATFPIDKDHSSMVKFPRGDSNLAVVTQIIMDSCPLDSHLGRGASTDINAPLTLITQEQNIAGLKAGDQEVNLTNTGKELQEVKILDELGQLLQSLEGTYGVAVPSSFLEKKLLTSMGANPYQIYIASCTLENWTSVSNKLRIRFKILSSGLSVCPS